MEKLRDNHKAYIPSPGGRGRRGGGNTSFFTLTPSLPAGRQPSPLKRLCRNPILMVAAGPAAGACVQLIDFIETARNLKVATTNYDTVSKGEGIYFRSLKIEKISSL
jgi:hypothetical protein